jgi:hypothetical protein
MKQLQIFSVLEKLKRKVTFVKEIALFPLVLIGCQSEFFFEQVGFYILEGNGSK